MTDTSDERLDYIRQAVNPDFRERLMYNRYSCCGQWVMNGHSVFCDHYQTPLPTLKQDEELKRLRAKENG